MKWITRAEPSRARARARAKTDRIACPWLIRRFIDPPAEILYVDPEQVLAEAACVGGHYFDAPGADTLIGPTPTAANGAPLRPSSPKAIWVMTRP